MKIFAPDYYKEFKCIADKCRHSCCQGWEIYIDSDTLEKYKNIDGSLGSRLSHSMCQTEDGTCFNLVNNDKCPFLNEKGLCDIITEKGEDYISEICREHPRFYNFFSDRTEVGLGLCCEEAARIILSRREITEFKAIGNDGITPYPIEETEREVLEKRERIFQILGDRTKSIDVRAKEMLEEAKAVFPQNSISQWAYILLNLEIMDSQWRDLLSALEKVSQCNSTTKFDVEFEKLLVYFVYRHTPASRDMEDFSCRVAFAYLGYTVIKALCTVNNADFDELCNIARMYSAEIEYSEENTDTLVELMRKNFKKIQI